ncbi:energy-coupling factor ABC transporter substrate-binding protein [Streptomyces pactum]|uniref:energy-coupling factor ABC transporter substrate-binding protein n=1 Tax=Streptomyces pactum TaxID=68249 RepID=UPI0036FFF0C0
MSRNARINALLLAVVALLAVLPVALGLGDDEEEPFTGADARAQTAITENDPNYEPWFTPLYEPPSGEIESALFAVQAALGAGVLAYYFGLRRGRRQGEARAAAAAAAAAAPDAAPAQAGPAPEAPAQAGPAPENPAQAGPRATDPGPGRPAAAPVAARPSPGPDGSPPGGDAPGPGRAGRPV